MNGNGFVAPSLIYRLLLGIVAMALLSILTLSHVTWRTDAWFYDMIVGHLSPPVDERIVVIAIDQKSLTELGRWPWSRRIHAHLIDNLTEAGVHGIALDLLLPEPTNSDLESDRLLAQAIRRNGNVVLPVSAEPYQLNSPGIELLPTPELARTAKLGHSDIALDADDVARSVFLYGGLGSPRWPSLALALWESGKSENDTTRKLPGLRYLHETDTTPFMWTRNYQVLIPYTNPPDGFPHLSYVDVLNKQIPDSALDGRWVIVGMTANGFSNGIAIPKRSELPGLYYQANVLNTLINGNAITPMTPAGQWLLASILTVLPLLFYRKSTPQKFWIPLASSAVLTLLIATVLLTFWHNWFPPMSALVTLSAITLGWLMRMWFITQQQAHSDPLTGLANRMRLNHVMEKEIRQSARTDSPLSLLMIDIDHFKQLNDTSGHDMGDRALRMLAHAVCSCAHRPRDLVSRLGGDEFAILLPETKSIEAINLAAEMHALISYHSSILELPMPFTVSIGVHTSPGGDEQMTPSSLLKAADTALYQAKQAGRNCTRSSIGKLPSTESCIIHPAS
ncbi:MAG: CHASE2 domain-containing protein [Xanthomonadaceae bacterium]|jgi:diguanylate cyclase (GGDEF)-like protein|nr:CHASE2 domain-containing protein [Xanthomonadaceae bacterium]